MSSAFASPVGGLKSQYLRDNLGYDNVKKIHVEALKVSIDFVPILGIVKKIVSILSNVLFLYLQEYQFCLTCRF